jgi:uncharacterized membrane protein YeiH
MVISILGYIGDIAFVIGGVILAKNLGLRPWLQLLSGMSTAFFGGIFLRDFWLLHTTPAIFGSPLEIAGTAAVGMATVAIAQRSKNKGSFTIILSYLLCAADAIGIVGFAAFGYGRGMQAGASVNTALATAFVTACGGGIIAALIRAVGSKDWRHFPKTLAGNWLYYLIGAGTSVVCALLYSPDGYPDSAILALTVAVIIGNIVNQNQNK